MSETATPATSSAPATQTTPAAPGVQDTGHEAKLPVAPDATEHKETAKPKATEKYEIKVNGKTKLVGRDELIRLAQISEAATERFESASQKERKAQQIIDQARQNPMAALLDPALGLSKEQVRASMEEWYNREFIEPELLTEDQRKYKALSEENAMYRKLQQEEMKRTQQAANEKAEAEYTEHFQKQIIDAMEQYKLPKTKSSVKRIAFYMRQALANGWEAPMDLIIQRVKEDRRTEDDEINEYSYEDIVDRFGEEFVKKVIAENLKRLRDKRAATGGSSISSKALEPSFRDPNKITMREAGLRLKAMRQGK